MFAAGDSSGVTIRFPAGSIVADDPITAAKLVVEQVQMHLVKLAA
jgi:hypothetical protein